MAAMFQAQTANWEETQEKMSQLVSRLSAFLVYSSRSFLMNFTLFFVSSLPLDFLLLVLSESTRTLEVEALVAAEPNHSRPITTNQIDLYLPAMFATDADRKVRKFAFSPRVLSVSYLP